MTTQFPTQTIRGLFFTPEMPPDKAQARYRGLVKVLHPDTPTGDTSLMQKLNLEFEAFERGTLLPAVPEPATTPAPTFDPLGSYFDAVRQKAERSIQSLPQLAGVVYEIDSLARLILATGKRTYDHREYLKVLGFRWDPERRAWARGVFV